MEGENEYHLSDSPSNTKSDDSYDSDFSTSQNSLEADDEFEVENTPETPTIDNIILYKGHPFTKLDAKIMLVEAFATFTDIEHFMNLYSIAVWFSLRLDSTRRDHCGELVMRRWVCAIARV